jgi:chromosome segregation ATPase
MPVEAELMVGPIGPDTIQIPGEPHRLKRAAEGLRDLCQQLDDIGKQLRNADAPEDKRGRTVRSLSRVAGRTGQTLQADSEKLQQLCDAVQHQSELLADAQGNLDQLRSKWRQARQELRSAAEADQTRRQAKQAASDEGGGHGKGHGAAHGGGNGNGHDDSPVNIAALIHSIDEDVADRHQQVIARLSGLHFGSGGGGGQTTASMLVDGELDKAMTQYRHQVDQVLEELTESLRRVHRADEQMSEHLPRSDKAVAHANVMDTDDSPNEHANVISGPEDIRTVAHDVRQAAQSIDQAAGQLREIRLGIREGRMLPDDDRVGSSDGFQRTWTQHFDDLRQDLNHARKAGLEIADRLREIDDNGARDVHRSARDQGGNGGGGGGGADA